MRAAVLQRHALQLDSAVHLKEQPDRLHADHDRLAPGIRVVVGPETRSLLKQLLESRDIRVQQELVREIIHQFTKRIKAARRRAGKAGDLVVRVAKGTRTQGRRLWSGLRWLAARARVPGRASRRPVFGRRKAVTRTRTAATARTRAATAEGRTTRTKRPSETAERTARPRTTRT